MVQPIVVDIDYEVYMVVDLDPIYAVYMEEDSVYDHEKQELD